VLEVEVVDRKGRVRTRRPEEYEIGYRRVVGPVGEWFAAAHLRLESCDGAASLARIREFLDRRNRTQPTGVPSCGSVFRNPPHDYAARLIDAAGLKGRCIGGACVSPKHANFIVNTGAATAAELEALILEVMETVASVHGVMLIPEVRVVGEVAKNVGVSNG
jgi:UDP-N-acetylmuramate dehydrogenase